jgi:magnesium chelatase family protein
MSVVTVYSAHIQGLHASPVSVEVHVSSGLYSFSIVGLPDKSIDESKDRVVTALKNSGLATPKSEHHKIIVSLAPADIKKEGAHFDVPIALGYLASAKKLQSTLEGKLFVGELSLHGEIQASSGILPVAEYAKQSGFKELYVPFANKEEAALVDGITVFGVKTLRDLVNHLEQKEGALLIPQIKTELPIIRPDHFLDFRDVRGQDGAKRALEIAAVGGHNIALYGPPGTGKTMLARAFTGILPPLEEEQILEVTRIHSIAGKKSGLITHPPFRSPHHTSSYVSLVGGGSTPKPGEVTLSHLGVLFLDEFPEFDKKVIESLREPLEEGYITIARAKGTLKFPARMITVLAMNPCPCGYYKSSLRTCTCKQADIERYAKKLSGPIVDRIDIWVPVQHIDYELLSTLKGGEETELVRDRVLKARSFSKGRLQKEHAHFLNRDLTSTLLETYAELSPVNKKLMNTLASQFKLSPRAYHRVLRVARSIADLGGSKTIENNHLMEAFQYRPKLYDL